MTKSQDSPVTRETNASERGRPIIATVKGSVLELRLKSPGPRVIYTMDFEILFAFMQNRHAEEVLKAQNVNFSTKPRKK